MTHRGPFQPLLFCDSVILLDLASCNQGNKHSSSQLGLRPYVYLLFLPYVYLLFLPFLHRSVARQDEEVVAQSGKPREEQ